MRSSARNINDSIFYMGDTNDMYRLSVKTPKPICRVSQMARLFTENNYLICHVTKLNGDVLCLSVNFTVEEAGVVFGEQVSYKVALAPTNGEYVEKERKQITDSPSSVRVDIPISLEWYELDKQD